MNILDYTDRLMNILDYTDRLMTSSITLID